ncbi:hypothetical protein Klosneuvirus_3_241 [Klosneuvirus KNV1]|uniref:Uncharacterized protein n=1 Tax=Klosneuvirus KNV1 TaxID=1977640 RepID=A0A1V0SK63_9VIRU|nr:hypothetical protein Klosneuvirus_3_241 [Klosneuvirus KNV1]
MHVLFTILAILLTVLSLFTFNPITYLDDTSNDVIRNVTKTIRQGAKFVQEINITHLNTTVSKLIQLADAGIPGIIEPTSVRKDQYLQRTNYNYTLAVKDAATRMNTPLQRVTRVAISKVPVVGIPYSLVLPYWQKVRYLLLVASLNNHTTTNATVIDAIGDCLINSALHPIGQKAEEKFIGKIVSYIDNIMNKFGFRYFHKVMSLPLQTLLIFLENDRAIIKCGKDKFG